MRSRKLWIGILLGVLIIFGLGVPALLLWTGDPHTAMPEALESLESDDFVRVETDPWLTFTPLVQSPTTGFILYPGALVEAEAYAPAARARSVGASTRNIL